MRIVCTLHDQKQARALSLFLAGEGIENRLEIESDKDWGSANYGDITCRIWVIDEDKLQTALKWVDIYEKDPKNPLFQKSSVNIPTPLISPPLNQKKASEMKAKPSLSESFGKFTFYILILCSVLFFIDIVTAPSVSELPKNLPAMPIMASQLKKDTLYDYPHAYEIIDKLVKLYGVNRLDNLNDLPPEGKYLLMQYNKTPYWTGFYPYIVQFLQQQQTFTIEPAPLFEKIREGEVWRLFTPCLMHNDILHLMFNMLWLIALGKQIEQRLRPPRYLLLILLIGIFSNTCQYLMSGANFLGFSGVLCGMLTFIWMRQRVAAWEGYPLPSSTIAFLMIFIFAMAALQVISLYTYTQYQLAVSPGIANTAHLSGAAIGAILGRLPIFSQRS